MSRKSTILALAAVASVGAFALSSTGASAFGGHGFHGAPPLGAGPHSGGGAPPLKPGPHFGGLGSMHVAHKPIFNPNWHWHWHWRHYGWRRPIWIAPVVAGGVATYAATTTPTYNRCTCLTKEYTPQGAVVFKDVCTNEMAMNPAVNASPTVDMAPQMPQQPIQQGYLQPQAQVQ